MSAPAERLKETDADAALLRDYLTLRASYREVLVRMRRLMEEMPADEAVVAAPRSAEARLAVCQQELERSERELAARDHHLAVVMASPTWKVGRAVTAAPRWLRDRRQR